MVERNTALPPFDLHCPLLSLPGIFNVTEKTIPAQIPYLFADNHLVEKWKTRFDEGDERLRVGLVWAGTAAHVKDWSRSIKLEMLRPLASVKHAALYSLQVGAQMNQSPSGMEILDWTNELRDFAETAALIANLDLIVTVDTSVAHLAGAMGKRVWVLIAKSPDWRWMLERTDSPWYPTMRLFRQSVAGDWAEVAERVAEAMRKEQR
jgi:hypothetical protein